MLITFTFFIVIIAKMLYNIISNLKKWKEVVQMAAKKTKKRVVKKKATKKKRKR